MGCCCAHLLDLGSCSLGLLATHYGGAGSEIGIPLSFFQCLICLSLVLGKHLCWFLRVPELDSPPMSFLFHYNAAACLCVLYPYQIKPVTCPVQYLFLPSAANAWYFHGWWNPYRMHPATWAMLCMGRKIPLLSLEATSTCPKAGGFITPIFFFFFWLIWLPVLFAVIKFSSPSMKPGQHCLSQLSSCGCKFLCSAMLWTQLFPLGARHVLPCNFTQSPLFPTGSGRGCSVPRRMELAASGWR